MERSPIFLIEPVPGIKRQELDLGSLGQIGRLVNDKPPGLHASLKRHATTVASAPPRNKVLETARGEALANRYPDATRAQELAKSLENRDQVSGFGTEGSEVQILSPRPIPKSAEFRLPGPSVSLSV